MRRLVALLWIVAVIGVGVPGTATAGQSQSTGPTVELLDPGAEPRATLRLSPASGSVIRQDLTTSASVRQSGAASNVIGPLDIRVVEEDTIGVVSPDGSFEISFTFPVFELLDSSEVDATSRRDIRDAFGDAQEITGGATVSSNGVVSDLVFDIPPDVDPAFDQFLEQYEQQASDISVPLPAEPVGVGAQWTVTQRLELNGIDVKQVHTYTLRAHEGTQLELDVKVRQTARRQPADLPGVPAGVEVEVTRWKVNGSGHLTHDLSRPYPSDGELRIRGRQVFRADDGEKIEVLRQRVRTEITVQPG